MPAAYVFSSLAQAQLAVSNMDGIKGPYPIAGTDIGAGMHAPPDQSVTKTFGSIWKHPTLAEWAYIADGSEQTLLPTKMPVPGVIQVDFNGTWAGATQVWP